MKLYSKPEDDKNADKGKQRNLPLLFKVTD